MANPSALTLNVIAGLDLEEDIPRVRPAGGAAEAVQRHLHTP
jgi:hypothetical protein